MVAINYFSTFNAQRCPVVKAGPHSKAGWVQQEYVNWMDRFISQGCGERMRDTL